MKDWGRDGQSNKAFPLTPPSPSGRGRTWERFVNVRRMSASIPRTEARRQRSPTNTCTTERPCALGPSRRAEWFSLSRGERVGVRGKGLDCHLRFSFQPLAPVLIPPTIARNQISACDGFIRGKKFTRTTMTRWQQWVASQPANEGLLNLRPWVFI